jgi:hypothetical protein
MRTYPPTHSPWTEPVYLWTVGGIADPLQDRGLPCVCPSDDEDPEPDIVGDFGEGVLLFVYGASRQLALDLSHALITVLSQERRLWRSGHARRGEIIRPDDRMFPCFCGCRVRGTQSSASNYHSFLLVFGPQHEHITQISSSPSPFPRNE